MRFEDANEMLKPGYLPFESGYQELEDGKWVVAGLTRMPGCRAKMVDWWFSWLGDIEWYRLWHPRDHVYSGWENRVSGKYIGASHLVHEYLAGKDGPLYKLRVSFREPSETFDSTLYRRIWGPRGLRATWPARSALRCRADDAFRAQHRLRLRDALALLARHDLASRSDDHPA